MRGLEGINHIYLCCWVSQIMALMRAARAGWCAWFSCARWVDVVSDTCEVWDLYEHLPVECRNVWGQSRVICILLASSLWPSEGATKKTRVGTASSTGLHHKIL